jgi:hypothetical protein
MADDVKNIRDTTFTITELSTYRFHYPYMGLIKGGKEVFIYDFTKGVYSYTRMNSPIAFDANTESVKTSITFRILLDLGPFYVYALLEAKD